MSSRSRPAGRDPGPRKRGAESPLTEAFRDLLRTVDATVSEKEAEAFGPWIVRRIEEGFGVFRDWELPYLTSRLGCPPTGLFDQRSHALLLAAVLAPLCREPLFRLAPEPEPRGFALETLHGERWVGSIGWVPMYQPQIAEALHLAEGIVRSPQALASLMEAAGPTTLELAVELLGLRLAERAREEEEEREG